MGTFENHKNLYFGFKEDAENDNLNEISRVELYFLSIFHLIEACAAKNRIHINKHQRVRKMLEDNTQIFGSQTRSIWTLFQEIENKLRPKFTYGFSWKIEDFNKVKEIFEKLEFICLKVIL